MSGSLPKFPKKDHQHHVWRAYLAAWGGDGGKIWCLGGGKVYGARPANLAAAKHFYKLEALSEAEINLIRLLTVVGDNIHPARKQFHEDFLAALMAPLRLMDLLKEEHPIPRELDEFISGYQTNVLEDYYGRIEDNFVPRLEKIKAGDLSFWNDDEECIVFFDYLLSQYMRTKAIREKTISRLKANMAMDLSRIWNVLAIMFGTNIGSSLFVERGRRKLIVLENRTGAEFLTGDQPVLNLLGKGPEPTTGVMLYYPISPSRALLLTEAEGVSPYSSETLTDADVAALNDRVVKAAHRQVFARSRSSLPRPGKEP